MKKKSLSQKLLKYTALVAAANSISDAEAAVIYTDEAPDFAGGIGSQYFLDLNNDGTDDFRIYHDGGSNLFIEPLAATNEVLGSGSPSSYAYPFALASGAGISSGAGSFFNNGFSSGYLSMNYGSCSFGNWCTVTDLFLGLRFNIGGNIHYGWARLDVDANGDSWTVKDYAYDDVVGAAISAGDTGTVGSVTADAVSAVTGADIADNANGDDLETTFTAAASEATVGEYRVIAVKSANAGTFDLTAAQALAATNYFTVTPIASATYTQVHGATLDSDGDAITNGQPYAIFVHSVADGTNATVDTLVQSAMNVTLTTGVIANGALNLVGTDIADNSNSTDLQVDFDAATSEAGISEYRVIAVTDASAATFDLAAAQALPATAYETLATGSANYTTVFGAATTDSDGGTIVIDQPYSIFVLSVADGVTANIDSLVQSTATVTLNTTADIGLAVTGSDISDNGDATDLQVDFNAAASEAGISEYRIIAVTDASAATFDLAAAQALPTTAYETVATGSANYTTVFGAATTDSDGGTIVIDQPYSIFVLSVADGVTANVDSLGQSAATVTLNTTADIGLAVTGSDISDNGDATDLQVDFNAAVNEAGISEYHVIAVPSVSAGTFDLVAAQALAATAYEIVATGSANYTVAFGATTTDSDGAAITEGTAYTIFVHSVANGTFANIDNLTQSGADITLEDLTASISEAILAQITLSTLEDHYLVTVPESAKDWSVALISSNGQIVSEQSFIGNEAKITKVTASGIYLISLRNDNGMIKQFKVMN